MAVVRNGASNSNGSRFCKYLCHFGLEDRGVNFMATCTEVYEGMIVGEHNR
ncbi:hypothetical protein ACVNP1_12670 [Staphylococcus aureus]